MMPSSVLIDGARMPDPPAVELKYGINGPVPRCWFNPVTCEVQVVTPDNLVLLSFAPARAREFAISLMRTQGIAQRHLEQDILRSVSSVDSPAPPDSSKSESRGVPCDGTKGRRPFNRRHLLAPPLPTKGGPK